MENTNLDALFKESMSSFPSMNFELTSFASLMNCKDGLDIDKLFKNIGAVPRQINSKDILDK